MLTHNIVLFQCRRPTITAQLFCCDLKMTESVSMSTSWSTSSTVWCTATSTCRTRQPTATFWRRPSTTTAPTASRSSPPTTPPVPARTRPSMRSSSTRRSTARTTTTMTTASSRAFMPWPMETSAIISSTCTAKPPIGFVLEINATRWCITQRRPWTAAARIFSISMGAHFVSSYPSLSCASWSVTQNCPRCVVEQAMLEHSFLLSYLLPCSQ